MGIQKSNLNDEKIKDLLKEKYDIIVDCITEVNRGTANIFKITADRKNIY